MAVDKRGRKLPKGIRQRGENFEGRFMYKGDTYIVHGVNITETQKKMTEMRYQVEHGQYITRKNITYDEWLQEWLEDYIKPYRKYGTWQTYNDLYNASVKEAIGKIQLQELTIDIIEKIYKNIQKKHKYSKSSMMVISAMIKGSLSAARRKRLIMENPAIGAVLPIDAKKTHKIERKALTIQQQNIFMEYAKDSYLYNLFAVLLRTGMRNGEIRALKYADIDKKNNVIHVCHTMKEIRDGTLKEDTPKSKTSLRDIPLTPDIIKYIEAQKQFWSFKVTPIERYLFCDENGQPLKRCMIQNEINRIIKKMEDDGKEFEHITPHIFRHTFATRAIEAGMSPQTLKTILGHSSLMMTMDLYSHVMEETKQSEMLEIAKAF